VHEPPNVTRSGVQPWEAHRREHRMDTLLTTLLTIVTAVVTTLVVEWFAKPGLEARKARILEQDKNLRRMCEIVLDFYDRETDKVMGRDTLKLELIEEYRTIQYSARRPRGRHNRWALSSMTWSFVGHGGHMRYDDQRKMFIPDNTIHIALCATLIRTPHWRILARRKLLRKCEQSFWSESPEDTDRSGDGNHS
jgi:hypothetical protein